MGVAGASGANRGPAAAPAERFDPFVEHKLVLDKTTGQAAAEVDLPLIYQAPQPKRQGFLVPGKGTLLGGNPGDLSFRDHTAGEGLQKDFTDSHESHVTKSLHGVTSRLGLRPEGAMAWTATPIDQHHAANQDRHKLLTIGGSVLERIPRAALPVLLNVLWFVLSGLLIDGPGLVR